ncbi:hypothetical protein C1645_757112 [Glomus cerebriforme]|uniref:Uncharacterized protein n=1 Tax=Glomus cerebriforme TaxID=658196 RepID=A0A397TGV5_9GLOM|nr:hypothetical protein C1645_757112 [Glomus cerebriforme]
MDPQNNNLDDNVYSYNNEFFTMNDNNNNFPAQLIIPPDYNYQQSISYDISNNNVINSPDQFNNDVSNDSDAISPDNNYNSNGAISSDNNYQQYDVLNNIFLNNFQQFMTNDTSNDDTIFPDHYHQHPSSLNNSQQYLSNGTPNDNVTNVTDQQCNGVIPPYNYQQSMHVDQPNILPSINITINSSQVSEIFRSGFKIVFMPITNLDNS